MLLNLTPDMELIVWIARMTLLCMPAMVLASTVDLVRNGDPKAVIVLEPEPEGIPWPDAKPRYFYGYREYYVAYDVIEGTDRYHQPDEFPRLYEKGDPHPAARHAANELVQHIRRMSGVLLPVVQNKDEIGDRLPIYIGRAADAALDETILAQTGVSDGFALVVEENAVHLRGLRPVGAQHAAYELLRQLGVRWFEPMKDGLVIPRHDTVTLDIQQTLKTPSQELRWLPRTTPRSIVYTTRMKEEHLAMVSQSPYVSPTPSADERFILGQTSGWNGDPEILLEAILYYVPETLPVADANGQWAVEPVIQPHNLYGYLITDPQAEGPKKRIVLTDGNHSEFPGSWIFHYLIEFLLSDDPRAKTMRQKAEFYVYPMVNPDGRYVMSRVQNPEVAAAGWDNHNRVWNVAGCFSTIDVLVPAMRYDTRGKVDYLIDFHSGFSTPTLLTYTELEHSAFAEAVSKHAGMRAAGRATQSAVTMTADFALHADGLNAPRAFTTEPPDWQPLELGRERGIGCALALHDVLTGRFDDTGDAVAKPPQAGVASRIRQRNASALMEAVAQGNLNAARNRLNEGDDINGINSVGNTALHLAAEQGTTDLARWLLEAGARVSPRNHRGWTPLHYAARYGNTEIADLLIGNAAEINARETGGDTPLHLAASYNRADIARRLLENGAQANAEGRWKRTAAQWAERLGYDTMIELLNAQKAIDDVGQAGR